MYIKIKRNSVPVVFFHLKYLSLSYSITIRKYFAALNRPLTCLVCVTASANIKRIILSHIKRAVFFNVAREALRDVCHSRMEIILTRNNLFFTTF